VLTIVGSTVDIGSPHVALAAAAATSHFRHFVTTTPNHFRHFTNSTANATATTTTTTPIKHIIVIFQENNSFDHYFGTYPNATNPTGEPAFYAAAGTPHVMNLIWPNNLLSPNNPNQNQPHRIDRSNPVTCNPLHDYTDEQKSYNGGKINLFVENDGKASGCQKTPTDNQVMDYFDGNTVTALWNYAKHFAMSDNFHGSTFGLSTPGHINLISGNTHGAIPANTNTPGSTHVGVVNGTLLGDIDPYYDICSQPPTPTIIMTGKNIGDLLNAKGISWGWFSDGFKLPIKGNCHSRQSHTDSSGVKTKDYYADVEPFQYYKSTANPQHLAPTSPAMVGLGGDQANHQYDLSDFWNATHMPAVSFIKAATYQQGHPKDSDPLAEQAFLVKTINRLQTLPEWHNTAIILTWDDSGGWYDHVMPPIISKSDDPKNDALYGKDLCALPNGKRPLGTYNDRCGYGPRIPMLIISPYAKVDFVDHNNTDFTSIHNWNLGRIGDQSFDAHAGRLSNLFDFRAPHQAPLILNPNTGEKR
jgi:phospholipase C